MNDYERKQAEELAAKKYPLDERVGSWTYDPLVRERMAFVAGYEAALETVAGDFLEQVDAELAEDLDVDLPLDPKPWLHPGPPLSRTASAKPGRVAYFAPRDGYSKNPKDYR